MTNDNHETPEKTKDKKGVMLVAGLACVTVGALSAFVGYKTGGFESWPGGTEVQKCLIYGSGVGLAIGVVTALLVNVAAREKWWLVAIAGCFLTFFGGCNIGNKQANDLHEWGRTMFQKGR
jgi:hypothetical protein